MGGPSAANVWPAGLFCVLIPRIPSLPYQLLILQPEDLAADRQADPDEEQAQNHNGHSYDEVDFVDVRRSVQHNQHDIQRSR